MMPDDVVPPVDEKTQELLERSRERGLKIVTPDVLEALDREADQELERQRCREIADRIVPRLFRKDVTLDPRVKTQVDEWINDFWTLGRDHMLERGNLALVGRPGCGKTHVAWMIVRHLLLEKSFDKFRWEDATPLFNEVAMMASNRTSDKPRLEPLCTTDLLILDDVGSKNKVLKETHEATLLHILDERAKAMLPTIITTNIAAPNFGAAFGDRNASRLANMVCRIVPFPNFDHRAGVDYSKAQEEQLT